MERILRLNGAIKVVYMGIKEPETFIGENSGRKRLEMQASRFRLWRECSIALWRSLSPGMKSRVYDGQRLNKHKPVSYIWDPDEFCGKYSAILMMVHLSRFFSKGTLYISLSSLNEQTGAHIEALFQPHEPSYP